MNKSICQSALTSSVRRAILKSSVVSFDVFDTLLLRPYVKPTDLFLHIEKAHHRPFFHDCRIAAEIAAREHTSAQDVTLDEIYEQIDNNFKDLKNVELDWEYMVLRANPQIREIYDFAKENGKRIIIASDMYLPSKFIARVLKANGFDGYEKLYVSSEIGVTKSRGTMFEKIIDDLKIAPSEILHIGDNRKSDYKNPHKIGMCAIQYPAPIKNFIAHNPRIEKFHINTQNDLGASILIAMLAYRNLTCHDDNYWHNLGYEYGGPVIYGYTRWIESVAHQNNISHLMFVARDGYTLQKVFKTFNNDIKNSYIYAPRFLNLICRLDYRHGSSRVALAQQNTIVEYYKSNKDIQKLYSMYNFKNGTLQTFIESNLELFKKLANDNFKTYKRYISTNLDKDCRKLGIVDTITENFSAQNLINAGISNNKVDITGFYWYVRTKSTNKFKAFVSTTTNDTPITYIKNWGLMEFLMTSPEYPIESISQDLKPIYKKTITPEEKHIRKIYPQISNGCVDFAHQVQSLFNGNDIFLTYDTCVQLINSFCDFPNKKDFINMSKIQTSSNPNNDIYESLFRASINQWYKFLHPIKYYKKIKSFMWNTAFEHMIISVLHPISMHTKGIRDISLYILPKSKHRFFTISIRLMKKINFVLILGAKHEI